MQASNTVAQPEGWETITVRIPVSLRKRVRDVLRERGDITLQKIVAEGLELRLEQLSGEALRA